MSVELEKPVIGFSCGDINGIGIEIIIKTLSDSRMLGICTPVVFANNKNLNFYRKSLPEINFSYNIIHDFSRLNNKQVNIFSAWDEEVAITPGAPTGSSSHYAILSLQAATAALQAKQLQALVTAPIDEATIYSDAFPYHGHTAFLRDSFKKPDATLLFCAENMRIAVLSENIPVKDIAETITREKILRKLQVIHTSLQVDFDIPRPKIAVLGLNPHAGKEGFIGDEENTIIKPAIKEIRQRNMLVFGPYAADTFFANGQFAQFDAVLAMYHDQGLIPFKSLAIGGGALYTAGLPFVHTAPNQGAEFEIAGKGLADPESFMEATFQAVDILRQREAYKKDHSNPLHKMSDRVLGNAVDEKVPDDQNE